MYKVVVMMSTYNGEKYIQEQIDSILSQTNVNVELIIRDDGSTDNTVRIIKEYYPEVTLVEGDNVGYRKSFLSLLKIAPYGDYYAFSDQDDYWLENKLEIAISHLKNLEKIPSFYCSNLKVVDDNLKFIRMLHANNEKINMSWETAIVENISYGCTLVFNNKMLEIAQKNLPNRISHDGWINLIGLFFGEGIYDTDSYILYRQHGHNTLGGDRRIISVWRKRIKSFSKLGEHHRDEEAKEFLDMFGTYMSEKQKEKILKVANYRRSILKKFQLLFDLKIKMSTFDRDFWYRVRILFSAI